MCIVSTRAPFKLEDSYNFLNYVTHRDSRYTLRDLNELWNPEQFSALSDGIKFVLRYYPCLTVEEGAYILQPNS